MNGKIGVLVKTSLVDFPGRVCASIFLKGCNLHCPYCYNISLAEGHVEDDYITLEELKNHLYRRKNVLSGITVSGGEALVNPNTKEIISYSKSLGYAVKLDTNGTLPDKLKELCRDKNTVPDYIAMDLKTSPENYKKLLPANCCSIDLESALKESIEFLSHWETEKREFRTVLVPSLVDENTVKKMGLLLPEDSRWFFAEFVNSSCLDSSYEKLVPYSSLEAEKIIQEAKKIIPGAILR